MSTFTDISLSNLCRILTLSHVGQELQLDLQTDHVSKTGLRCNQGYTLEAGERGGSVVECRTPEREVGVSIPIATVLCP